jgi:hypothetical protein
MPRILNWFRTFSRPNHARKPHVHLCLEALGDRLLQSVSALNASSLMAGNAALFNATNLQPAVCALQTIGVANLVNQQVQLTNSSGHSDGTLTITSEDANGNFQGVYSNPNLSIASLPVAGTISAGAIHFDGTRSTPLVYGSDVQSVTYDGTLCLSGHNFSTTGTIRASDMRSAGYLSRVSPGTALNPAQSGPLSFGAVGVPNAGLVQQGRAALPLLNEVDDTVSGTFMPA